MKKNELEELEEILERIKLKPSKITLLDILNKKYDENIVTNWLKFIFDPRINGIGNEPIKCLLNSVEYDEKNLDELEFIDIEREESTDDKKRMDLVIKYSDVWIIIENKIGSKEHNKQTDKYFKYIEKEKEKEENERKEEGKEKNKIDTVYIYLRPDWNEPENMDVPSKKYNSKENGFRNLFYSKLIDNLKKINYFNYKEQEKFNYLKDFIEIGEKYYMGKEIEITDSMKLYVKYMEKIDEIHDEYNNLLKNISNKIEDDLKNEFPDDYVHVGGNNTFFQIINSKWNEKEKDTGGIHYEIMIENFANLLNKRVKVKFNLHIEGSVSKEKKQRIARQVEEKYNDNDIRKEEKPNQKTNIWYNLEKEDKYFDFSDEYNINKSIKEIIENMKRLDIKWRKEIDSWSNL